MCWTDAFALRNAPRRCGTTLLVTIAMAAIMRPTLHTISKPKTANDTYIGPGGKCVITMSNTAEIGISTR